MLTNGVALLMLRGFGRSRKRLRPDRRTAHYRLSCEDSARPLRHGSALHKNRRESRELAAVFCHPPLRSIRRRSI